MIHIVNHEIATTPLSPVREKAAYKFIEKTMGPQNSFKRGQRRLRTEIQTLLPRDRAVAAFHEAFEITDFLREACLNAAEKLNDTSITVFVIENLNLERLVELYRSLGMDFLARKEYENSIEIFRFLYEKQAVIKEACPFLPGLGILPHWLAVAHFHLGDLEKAASYILLHEIAG
jgi:tetratricopeptide (TPR) repeat protein